MCRTGDGALWVADMYRFVIEHPKWIPPAAPASSTCGPAMIRAGFIDYPAGKQPRRLRG